MARSSSEGTSFWKRGRKSKRRDPKNGRRDVGDGMGMGGPGFPWESVTLGVQKALTGSCVGVRPES